MMKRPREKRFPEKSELVYLVERYFQPKNRVQLAMIQDAIEGASSAKLIELCFFLLKKCAMLNKEKLILRKLLVELE